MNTPAQFFERSTAAKERFQNLLYKPIILNSELHASPTPNCSASLWRSSVTNVFRCGVLAARWVVVERKGLVVGGGEKAGTADSSIQIYGAWYYKY